MKRLLIPVTLTGALVLIAPVGRTAMQDAKSQNDSAQVNLKTAGEQIEIMRLVLTRSINSEFSDMLEKAFDKAKKSDESNEGTSGTVGMGGGSGAGSTSQDAVAPATTAQAPRVVGLGGGSAGGRLTSGYVNYGEALVSQPTTTWVSGSGGFYGSQYTSHTRGFYTPGFGVYFTTEVNTPTSMNVEKSSPETDEQLDAWDEAERQVQQGQSSPGNVISLMTRGNRPRTIRRLEIADAYVDAAVNAIIDTIGKYGLRLDQLSDDESIAVGLRFEPGLTLPVVAERTETSEDGSEQTDSLFQTYVVSGVGSVEQANVKHVVVQVRKSDIRRLQSGQLNQDTFRNRVSVTKY